MLAPDCELGSYASTSRIPLEAGLAPYQEAKLWNDNQFEGSTDLTGIGGRNFVVGPVERALSGPPEAGVVGVLGGENLLPGGDAFLLPIVPIIENVILDLVAGWAGLQQWNLNDVEKLSFLAALVATLHFRDLMRGARADGSNPVRRFFPLSNDFPAMQRPDGGFREFARHIIVLSYMRPPSCPLQMIYYNEKYRKISCLLFSQRNYY